ncbi:MAG TPA: class I SAM-dependent methyltransferase [candidate division Zixibacteria bacterium]|nr:class I SAM-dependent methyltransferase [candidate division Zixibacteria bacterium]
MSEEYYSKKLSANKLKKCYDIASPRIRQYLEAEIQYTLKFIHSNSIALELGCGYGRVLKRIASKAKLAYGIDNSKESLQFARKYLENYSNIKLFEMNVKELSFEKNYFDCVIVIQNGISAFKVDPHLLIKESIRVTKIGGKIILSSYSEKIWKERLEWFIEQAKVGVLGEIDLEKSHDGIIIGKDGFKATTFLKEDFEKIILELNLSATIEEIDDSSIFCVISVK